jgi:CotH kinase protein/Lamin Tail Domain/Chitobiase/beta-hexosaminidase C-terminal domain
MKTLKLILCLLLFSQVVMSQDLVINEFMSSNQSFIIDENGDDSDWIEIFNNTPTSINLSNYFLSDKSDSLTLWQFPNAIIDPYDYILVFASGKDRIAGIELHTNFKIKASGEELFLTLNGTIIHQTPSVDLSVNQSFGLFPDGGALFTTFAIPTPASSNIDSSVSTDDVIFSISGGIYENDIQLQLINLIDSNSIYYTLDGTSPTTSSILYGGEIMNLSNAMCSNANINQIQISPAYLHNPPSTNIPKGIVIRAASFDLSGNRISEVVTNSYFIENLGINHHLLPIVSINAEHLDLFDFDTGIFVPGVNWDTNNVDWTGNYYHRGDDWERTIHVEFYEPNTNNGFKQSCGLRIHGGNTRRMPQKGLRIYARSEYGTSEFNYPVFQDKTIDSYKRLVLKPFSSSWSQAGIEDYVTNKMALNTNVDGVATRPVVLYINGEYWGIYYLQEKIDDYFIEANYGIHRDSVDMIYNWLGDIAEGENVDFLNLYSFIMNNDISIETNYNIVKNRIDIDNFIDYQLYEIFIANYDWPVNNMKCWRERKAGAKWRWIFFDGDAAFQNYEFNSFAQALNTTSIGWPTNPTATLFLRKLMENEVFYLKFFNRLEALANSSLAYSETKDYFNNCISLIDNELNGQINRFSIPESYVLWSEGINNVNYFLALRNCEIKDQVKKMFNVDINLPICNESDVSTLIIFPNPNNGNFTLTFNSNYSSPAIISITDIIGRNILQHPITIVEGENLFNFQSLCLPKGIIIVNVVTDKNVIGTKMFSY